MKGKRADAGAQSQRALSIAMKVKVRGLRHFSVCVCVCSSSGTVPEQVCGSKLVKREHAFVAMAMVVEMCVVGLLLCVHTLFVRTADASGK